MKLPLESAALHQLFRSARTYPAWQDRQVSDEQIAALYELLKHGPTSMNCQPGRLLFLRTPEAKARLKPALMAGNIPKVESAPVTVIVAHDSRFYEHLPTQWPHMPEAAAMFTSNAELSDATAFRNGTLQGAYLILAARGLGLDCGPMSGFDNAKLDEAFFPDGRYRSNFLVNIGYGDDAALHPRGPRLAFETAVTLL